MTSVVIILVLMIAGAVVTLQANTLLSSVVAVGAVGLGLALAALILHAPDVALTQLVVEVITVVILIRACLVQDPLEPVWRSAFWPAAATLVFLVVVLAFSAPALSDLHPFGDPTLHVSTRYIEQGLGETGAANLVTAVLLDYRAWDTLGEATVLFAAVIGVLAVTRKRARPEEPAVSSGEVS